MLLVMNDYLNYKHYIDIIFDIQIIIEGFLKKTKQVSIF